MKRKIYWMLTFMRDQLKNKFLVDIIDWIRYEIFFDELS